MRIFSLFCIFVTNILVFTPLGQNLNVSFLSNLFQASAKPYTIAVGKLEKDSGNHLVVNTKLCGSPSKLVTLSGNFRKLYLRTETCNGKAFEVYRVVQCGGNNDSNHPICKSN